MGSCCLYARIKIAACFCGGLDLPRLPDHQKTRLKACVMIDCCAFDATHLLGELLQVLTAFF
jgi:hypothetical protein